MSDVLAALPDGYVFRHMDITESTNTDALNWVEQGLAPKALFIADSQTAGRGRRGRAWNSYEGNLLASLLIPCPEDLREAGHMGFAISLAIYQAIRELAPSAKPAVKWPNDVLLDGRKCAGILMEIGEGAQGKGLVIGFGLNIAHAPENALYETARLDDIAHGIPPLTWAAAIMRQFFTIQQNSLAEILNEWRAVAHGIGTLIRVNLPSQSISGTFIDIDADGALLLQNDEGIQKYYTGDVFFPNRDAA